MPCYTAGETIYWTVDYITASKMRIQRWVKEPGKTYLQADTYTNK
ncbi:MAG: hypothetical protein U0V75_14505 [Ferruginibacter sp.]